MCEVQIAYLRLRIAGSIPASLSHVSAVWVVRSIFNNHIPVSVRNWPPKQLRRVWLLNVSFHLGLIWNCDAAPFSKRAEGFEKVRAYDRAFFCHWQSSSTTWYVDHKPSRGWRDNTGWLRCLSKERDFGIGLRSHLQTIKYASAVWWQAQSVSS